ncbi:unnamed protein product [Caenorhabditis angaria]|uniref:Uncharacterized protein n=1 Tax=Caenorhabditis angaria TaxID=860376 RepID=A0A9P1J1F2_9PELO|nr:unnamed protein product [Caenorhabditis angaria]
MRKKAKRTSREGKMNRIDVIDPRSMDSTDQRRVHAVQPTPMYQGETKILDSLLKEAHMNTNLKSAGMVPMPVKEDGERKLHQMLEKYQNEMKMQQQRPAPSNSRKPDMQGRPSPISHSQPCLIASGSRTSLVQHDAASSSMSTSAYIRRSSASGDQVLEVPVNMSNSNNNRNVSSNQKLIQSLRDENIHLKKELEAIKRSLSKLQQIEFSYGRLEKEYEFLSNERKKQENLELNAIIQLEKTVKKLTLERDELQIRLEKSSTEPSMVASLMLNEIQQRENFLSCKERQKLEIEAQNQTLEELRNHITMLEKALTNSRERLAKREEKCEELTNQILQSEELKKQLTEIWEEQQRRELMIEAERAQWEMEKTQLLMQLQKDSTLTGSLKRTSTPGSTEDIMRMRKNIQTKDDKISYLEKCVVDLKRTLNDETERRKSTLTTIADSFEARIKRLEDEKLERDQIISELKQEREKYGTIIIEKNSDQEAMNRMEEIRQKIQERKKKGRIGVPGGLCGISSGGASEHYRSTSGSSHLHRRSSSGQNEQEYVLTHQKSSIINNNSSSANLTDN